MFSILANNGIGSIPPMQLISQPLVPPGASLKDWRFGDVNAYRRRGLLRTIRAPGWLTLAYGWMLAPDNGSPDGGFTAI